MNAPQALFQPERLEGKPEDRVSQHGVLPWRMTRKSGLRILLVSPVDGEDWKIPAGVPVEGRAPFLSAALHAFQEAGIIGEIDTAPLGNHRSGKVDREDSQDRFMRVFAMKVRGTLSHWKRQDQYQRRWFSAHEAAAVVQDAGLAAMIRRFAEDATAPEENGTARGTRNAATEQASPAAL